MSSRCQECDRLKQLYTDAVNAYGNSVKSLQGLKGAAMERARQRVQEADKACQTTQQALLEHQRQARCPRTRAEARGTQWAPPQV